MAVYIRSAIAISPQNTFLENTIPEEPVVYTNLLQNILPDFKTYFEPLERRRMSRIIKTGAVCAIEAIKNAGIKKPDMIISGTGLGCIEDTEKFLNNVLTSETSMHTPTAFVQSTHNSIGALIAVKYKCHGYNVLYANKTVSFEQALLDSVMHYVEGESGFILLNGFDEITAENYELKKKVGLYKKEECNNIDIINCTTTGSMPGEGASSFILTDIESDSNLATVNTIDLRYSLKDKEELKTWITEVLKKQNLTVSDVDLIISGINGDKKNDSVYKDLMNSHFPESMHASYKHLCGEYDTASAFGLWLGTQAIRNQFIPDHCLLNNKKKHLNRILIYNNDHFKDHSLILLSK